LEALYVVSSKNTKVSSDSPNVLHPITPFRRAFSLGFPLRLCPLLACGEPRAARSAKWTAQGYLPLVRVGTTRSAA
jgi:hypothetical protein